MMIDKNEVLRLWATTDMSAERIGAELGLRKNQVIGLVNRASRKVGVTKRADFGSIYRGETPAMTPIPYEARVKKQRKVTVVSTQPPDPPPLQDPPDDVFEVSPREVLAAQVRFERAMNDVMETMSGELRAAVDAAVLDALLDLEKDLRPTIMDLKYGMCRAVEIDANQPGGFYCGKPVKLGKSFCPECYSRYFRPPEKRKKGYHSTPTGKFQFGQHTKGAQAA